MRLHHSCESLSNEIRRQKPDLPRILRGEHLTVSGMLEPYCASPRSRERISYGEMGGMHAGCDLPGLGLFMGPRSGPGSWPGAAIPATPCTPGLAYDTKGRLIGVPSNIPRVAVLAPTRMTLVEQVNGLPLVAPNDLLADKKAASTSAIR